MVSAINKNKTTAGNWKRNNTIPKEDILRELADELDCRVSDFFREEGEPRYRDDVEAMEAAVASGELTYDGGLDEYQEDFLAIYDALSPKDRMRLMNMAYGLADERGVEL